MVCGQAVCDYTTPACSHRIWSLWFAVRLYAITLKVNYIQEISKLWFAVRLYAITLLRAVLRRPLVVVCGQAVCDYTNGFWRFN